MHAAPHVSQGPPTHRVAYGLTVQALLQLLSYLPVFGVFLALWTMISAHTDSALWRANRPQLLAMCAR